MQSGTFVTISSLFNRFQKIDPLFCRSRTHGLPSRLFSLPAILFGVVDKQNVMRVEFQLSFNLFVNFRIRFAFFHFK